MLTIEYRGLDLETLSKKLDKNGEPIENQYNVTLSRYGSRPCKFMLDVHEDEIDKFLTMDYVDISISFHKFEDSHE